MIRWPWGRVSARGGSDGSRPVDGTGRDARRLAFERLAAPHAADLYGAALRMARNPDDAQDLAQDTLVRAYVAFDSFETGTNFRAWLLRILTNGYINLYRRRQKIGFVPWDEGTDEGTSRLSRAQGDRRAEPEAALLASAMDAEIEAALARLAEGVRLTLLLVDVEEMSYEEAAAALAVPIGTVRSRLNRGREQMRRLLHDYARERRLVGKRDAERA